VPRRKRSEYAVEVDEAGRAVADGRIERGGGDGWTPEHLLLAALAKCVLTSLRYHARRHSLSAAASASARGAVFERPDGSWGFVELECRVEATLEPQPGDADLRELVVRAGRGCFVGASLDPRPRYTWRVNGTVVA
jgi:organic hydroperoxide reductase OsmC/OhrA